MLNTGMLNSIFRDEIFWACHDSIDVDAFISRCKDTACTCLNKAGNDEDAVDSCKCEALQSFVVSCMEKDSTVSIENWRGLYDCRKQFHFHKIKIFNEQFK